MKNTEPCLALNHLGLINIEGIDAAKFLQGQLTCNLEALDNGDSSPGAHCDPKGRVLSFFRLFKSQDVYFMQMPSVSVQQSITYLNKYSVFFKTNVSDVSDDYAQRGFFDAPNLPENPNIMRFFSEHPTPRHLLILHKKTFDTYLKGTSSSANLTSWRTFDILSEIPVIYPETTGKFLPHRLNLPALGAVSFSKGCYTGQEIIARTEYLGKLKHRLLAVTAKTSDTVEPGMPILSGAGKKIGDVVDACFDGKDTTYVLAILPKDTKVNDGFLHNTPLMEVAHAS